jgi:hypothetical protein
MNEGENNAWNDIDRRLNFGAPGRTTEMAAQQGLGLRANRRTRSRSGYHCYSSPPGADLTFVQLV